MAWAHRIQYKGLSVISQRGKPEEFMLPEFQHILVLIGRLMLLIISSLMETRLSIDKYLHVSNLCMTSCLVSFQEALCQRKNCSSNFFQSHCQIPASSFYLGHQRPAYILCSSETRTWESSFWGLLTQ